MPPIEVSIFVHATQSLLLAVDELHMELITRHGLGW